MIKNKLIISISILTVVCALFLNTTVGVRAHDVYYGDEFARKLATRFNLNENEVREFIRKYPEIEYKSDRTGHLGFIDEKLTKGVRDGWLTQHQKDITIVKLEEMMKKQPSSDEFQRMSERERNDRINEWKKEMSKWARSNGFTLDRIRNLTGKGNKYLMGISF